MTGPDRSICKSAREHPRSLLEKESGVSCKNIRLSSAGGNSLRRSRNWRADGDGCVGLHLMQVSRRRAQGFNGFHRQRLIAKKPLRRFLRFTVAPTLCSARAGRPWQGSLSDRILIAENGCAALFVSTVSLETLMDFACGEPGPCQHRVKDRHVPSEPRGSSLVGEEVGTRRTGKRYAADPAHYFQINRRTPSPPLDGS